MKQYGLIGKNISYSFSKKYFTDKFEKENISNSSYELFDIQDARQLESVLRQRDLKGVNITIPYKKTILSYLDELSVEAKEIQAVNCIKFDETGKRTGYNTDAFGFEKSLFPLLENQHKKALILGSGGAAQAVKYVLKQLKIDYKIVSRKGNFTYSDLNREIIQNYSLIINCTPAGTYPNLTESPNIPYEFLTSKHLLYDLIYNPVKTHFLQQGEERGAKIKNGEEMLILQAEKSWEIWNGFL